MKMRYTPWQMANLSVEEPNSPYHHLFQGKVDLEGTPVLIGELHSMLPVLCTWLHHRGMNKIAYVMTDGAALPMAYSNHVRNLRQLGWLEGTVTVGHCFGGDYEAVNIYTGLIAAKKVIQADAIIVAMGPGIVGTQTSYGFSGVEVAETIHASVALGALPVAVPRMSECDARERHQGISHHTLKVLGEMTFTPAVVPIGVDDPATMSHIDQANVASKHWMVHIPIDSYEMTSILKKYPLPLKTMGRDEKQDPSFFKAVAAAAEFTSRWLALDDALRKQREHWCELARSLGER